jgi:hypothetical protein
MEDNRSTPRKVLTDAQKADSTSSRGSKRTGAGAAVQGSAKRTSQAAAPAKDQPGMPPAGATGNYTSPAGAISPVGNVNSAQGSGERNSQAATPTAAQAAATLASALAGNTSLSPAGNTAMAGNSVQAGLDAAAQGSAERNGQAVVPTAAQAVVPPADAPAGDAGTQPPVSRPLVPFFSRAPIVITREERKQGWHVFTTRERQHGQLLSVSGPCMAVIEWSMRDDVMDEYGGDAVQVISAPLSQVKVNDGSSEQSWPCEAGCELVAARTPVTFNLDANLALPPPGSNVSLPAGLTAINVKGAQGGLVHVYQTGLITRFGPPCRGVNYYHGYICAKTRGGINEHYQFQVSNIDGPNGVPYPAESMPRVQQAVRFLGRPARRGRDAYRITGLAGAQLSFDAPRVSAGGNTANNAQPSQAGAIPANNAQPASAGGGPTNGAQPTPTGSQELSDVDEPAAAGIEGAVDMETGES